MESSDGKENKEKSLLRINELFIARGRSEILIIRKDISPNPNTSIKTTKISTSEAKRNFFPSSPRIMFKDLNKSITVMI